MIGKRIGKYKILSEIGRGGMGVVYKALQTSLNRTVALKMLPPQMALSREFLERFQREARILARLAHPNIVHIYDLEEHGGTFYIVMEFVEGRSLAECIRDRAFVTPATVRRVGLGACSALAAANTAGIIHRDIKPENIMLDRLSEIKVMDFGIARAADESFKTRAGIRLGTPEYMSPEQAKGLDVDAQSDLYSLGIVLYEMITGRVPFSGSDSIALALKHINEPIPPISSSHAPRELADMVLRLLEKDRRRRFPDARAARSAFESLDLPDVPPPQPAGGPVFMFCPECGQSLKEDFLRCPECGLSVRRSCPFCGRLFDAVHTVCPHCSRELPEIRSRDIPQTLAVAEAPGNASPPPRSGAPPMPAALTDVAAAVRAWWKRSYPVWQANIRRGWSWLRARPPLLAAAAGSILILVLALILFSGDGSGGGPDRSSSGGVIGGGGGGGNRSQTSGKNEDGVESTRPIPLPDSSSTLTLARDYFDRGAFDLCAAELRKTLETEPDNAEARALLSRIEEVRGEVETGLETARDTFQKKEYARCLEACDAVLAITPKHPQILEIRDLALAQYPEYTALAETRHAIQAIIARQKTAMETENLDLLTQDMAPELFLKVKSDAESFFQSHDVIKVEFSNIRLDIRGNSAEVDFTSTMVFKAVDTGRERRDSTRTHWRLAKAGKAWQIVEY